jgi:hypothetical protein
MLAHTQSALALLRLLLRLESRGRYLAAASLECELGAALVRPPAMPTEDGGVQGARCVACRKHCGAAGQHVR